ncbi:MAG: glycosyltransferase family 4 protein [Bdellovibrionota bacterium]
MKIGFVIPINGLSGGLQVAYTHAHFLASQGHEVEVLISDESAGLNITAYPGFRLKTRSLKEAIRSKLTYDVLIATWWETYYEMFGLTAGHYLYFCQSDERRFYDRDHRVLFVEQTYRDRQVGVITEAKWIQAMLKKEFGVDAEYAPNGIDLKLFHPDVAPLEPKSTRRRILIEGPGGQAFKRVDLAFRVAAHFPEAEVWYVSSDGVCQPQWRHDRLLTKMKLQDMPAIYASCDVLLKLSTVEGFFGPPLEMMACGGTSVVTKVSGYDEYVRDQENALAVELDDEEGAVAAVRSLLSSDSLRKKLSEEGVRTARSMGWEGRLPLFERAVHRLVQRDRHPGLPFQIRLENDLRRTIEAQEKRIKLLEDQLYNWRPFKFWKQARGRWRAD